MWWSLTRSPIKVVPANQATWEDIEAVVGKARSWDSLCFCQRFKLSIRRNASTGLRDRRATTAEERAEMLRKQTDCGYPESDSTTGMLAYVGGEPAGWCCVEPCPRSRSSRSSGPGAKSVAKTLPTTAYGWSPASSHERRSRTPASAARSPRRPSSSPLFAVLGAVEGCPMVTQPGVEITWGELHVGSRSIFADAGMREVAAPSKRRVVMRIDF